MTKTARSKVSRANLERNARRPVRSRECSPIREAEDALTAIEAKAAFSARFEALASSYFFIRLANFSLNLANFGAHDVMTVWLVRDCFLKVLLMIALGNVELRGRHDFGNDRVSAKALSRESSLTILSASAFCAPAYGKKWPSGTGCRRRCPDG